MLAYLVNVLISDTDFLQLYQKDVNMSVLANIAPTGAIVQTAAFKS